LGQNPVTKEDILKEEFVGGLGIWYLKDHNFFKFLIFTHLVYIKLNFKGENMCCMCREKIKE
jgi:hypothetical protein